MTPSDSHSVAVVELADEFLARYRRGERPSLKEYTDRFPDLAAEILDVFPAMAMIERVAIADGSLAGDRTGPGLPTPSPSLAQLGDYRIIREVGRGGMGVVYEAEQLSLGRHVALKVLPGHGLLNPTYLERFRREAKAAARLHHTNIVPVFGTGDVDGTHFYAMQFIRGEGLDRVLDDLRRLRRPGEPPPTPGPADAPTLSVATSLVAGSLASTPAAETPSPDHSSGLSSVTRSGSEYFRSVARIGVQVAEALTYAHKQGVLHRDIKPSNLLLDTQGTAWVTDFGLAKADGDDLTHTGDIVGTIRYMAPERFDGKSLPESDVYSLGLTLYELLTLRPAFDAPNRAKLVEQVLREPPPRPRKVDPYVPRDLETVVLKCVAKDPKDRYATADELAEDLRRFLADRTIRARRATNAELAWRWCRRNPAVASLVTVVVILLIGVSVASSVAAVRMKRLADDEQAARRAAEEAGAAERWERYRANVSAAASALWVQNAPTAGRHLEAAPPAHRNWEWRYLHARLDGARAVLRGHEADVTQVDFSADGRRLASGAQDGTVRLWDPDTGRESAVLRGHGHWVKSIRFSPVGTVLAVASFPDEGAPLVHVWDAADARLVRTLPATHRVGLLAWTPDGHHLAGHAADAPGDPAGRLSVWDIRTGVKTATLEGSTDGAVLVIRPGGRHLARGLGGACLVWDREAGREVFRTEPVAAILRSLAYSPDGRRLAAGFGDPDNRVRLLDSDTGRPLAPLGGHTNTVVSLAFSPDGSRLASSSMDQTVRLWDGVTGDLVAVLRGHAGSVPYVTFTPDGRYLLSASPDGTVRLWDGAAGGLVAVLRGHQGPVYHVDVRPDGRTIASASADGTVRLWDTELVARNGVLTGHTKFVYDVAVRPDGRELASAAWDGTVRLWDPTTGRETGALRLPAADPIIGGVAYHPDGRRLAAVYRGGRIALWDLATRTVTREVRAPTGSWAADPRPVFNPAGTLLAVGCSGGTVHLIDPATGERVGALVCSTSPDVELSSIEGVAFSPDGAWLAVGCYDQTVQVWDVRARERRQVLSGHPGPVFAVAFSPDGRLLASADRSGQVRLWDTTNFQEVAMLPHRGAVYAVAFSPDGTRLACGCVDNSVHLWDVVTRQEVVELRGHELYVHAVAWSPDGTRLVSGSGDTTVRLWDSLSLQERAGPASGK